MSTTSKTLLSLPTEILHRIFDNLDKNTILLSVQGTCKQLQLTVNTYNRFKLNEISKQKLLGACQVLSPENIMSLCITCDTNSDSSINYLEKFIYLRSLTLTELSDNEFNLLLDYLPTSPINELTIDFARSKSKFQFIDSVKDCTLQRLSLNYCTYKQFSFIMRHCPNLHKLSVSSIYKEEYNETLEEFFNPILYSTLTGVTLNDFDMSANDCEILLSCMPSILRLDFYGKTSSVNHWFDGSFLQTLITNKLPQLKHFKYYFLTSPDLDDDDHDDDKELEQIISSFRTPFWCEENKWFFSCTLLIRFPNIYITVESPPTELTCLNECLNERYFSLFNLPVSTNGRVTIDTMHSVNIDLDAMMTAASQTKANYANYYYFSHPTYLSLEVSQEWKNDWLQSLLSLMELAYLEGLGLEISRSRHQTMNSDSLLTNITVLLDRAPNVHELRINGNDLSMNKICSIVPRRIKTLTIWVKTYGDMKTILEQLDFVSMVTFRYEDYKNRSESFAQIIQWLTQEKQKTFTHKKDRNVLEISFH